MQIDVDVPQIKSNTMNSQTNWWIECCIARNLGYIPIKNIVISLITDASGVHPKKNG
jgi:hypothetical protein